MTDVPLTVALVVKNEIDFIDQAIDSLFSTSPCFVELKILIIDDDSQDGTYEYCKALESKDAKVTVVENRGVGKVAGTLTALSLVPSGWMKFVDGDDYVDFSALAATDFDCDAFYHDFYSVSESGRQRRCRTSPKYAVASKPFVLKLRTIPKAMFFFKRALFDDLEEHALLELMFEDVFINFYIGIRAKKISKLDKPLYYYRQHNANYYGGSFRRNPEKVAIMAQRLITSRKILGEIHGSLRFHPAISTYVQALESLTNWTAFLKLCVYPEFLLKAVYYHLLSRI